MPVLKLEEISAVSFRVRKMLAPSINVFAKLTSMPVPKIPPRLAAAAAVVGGGGAAGPPVRLGAGVPLAPVPAPAQASEPPAPPSNRRAVSGGFGFVFGTAFVYFELRS